MELFCSQCGSPFTEGAKFCGNCGARAKKINSEKERSGIQLIITFYITYLVYAIVAYSIYAESDSLLTEIVLESVFVLLTLLFCFFDAKHIFSLYNIKKIDGKGMLFSILFPIFTGFLVYYGIEWLNIQLHDENPNLFYNYMFYDSPFLWAFLFFVIIPPVFEELAFRGFLFNQLQIVATPQVTILATAFIFALVHFSFLSFIWIFPFGIVLGYLRHRYNTLWLGMLVHFIHNLLIVLLDYYFFDFGFFSTF